MAVLSSSLLKTRREAGTILLMMGLALGFAWMLGTAFGAGGGGPVHIPLGVTDYDVSPLSEAMILELGSGGLYTVERVGEEELRKSVAGGKVEVGFIIPQGFQASLAGDSPMSIESISLSSSNLGQAAGKGIERAVSEYILARATETVAGDVARSLGVDSMIDAPAVSERAVAAYQADPALTATHLLVTREDLPESDKGREPRLFIGIFLMFSMFAVMFSAGDILKERAQGTWARLLSTPTSKSVILGGKVLGTFAIGVFQVAVLFLAGWRIFGMELGRSPCLMASVLALFALCVTGMGVFLSTLVRTTAQLQAVVPTVVVSTSMLGGLYWPLEVTPRIMQIVGKFTPQAWAMMALDEITVRNGGIGDVLIHLGVLSGMTILFFVFGVFRTRFE